MIWLLKEFRIPPKGKVIPPIWVLEYMTRGTPQPEDMTKIVESDVLVVPKRIKKPGDLDFTLKAVQRLPSEDSLDDGS